METSPLNWKAAQEQFPGLTRTQYKKVMSILQLQPQPQPPLPDPFTGSGSVFEYRAFRTQARTHISSNRHLFSPNSATAVEHIIRRLGGEALLIPENISDFFGPYPGSERVWHILDLAYDSDDQSDTDMQQWRRILLRKGCKILQYS